MSVAGPAIVQANAAVEPQVVFERVTYRYPGAAAPALDGVNFAVEPGEFVLVAGPSASGKSTLLRCLNGLVPHFSGGHFGGVVSVAGQDTSRYGPRALSRLVGFVFQDPEAQLVAQRVEDDLAFGMEQLGVPPLTMRKRVEEVLDLLGIAALRARDVTTLSGGERQRVAIAAALTLQPALLALDEPTSQLDPWGAEEVLTALSRLNEDLGLTVVLAEHRLERVLGHADRLRYLSVPGSHAPVRDGTPRSILPELPEAAVPALVQLGRRLGWDPLPLSIRDGRAAVQRDAKLPTPPPPSPAVPSGAPVLTLHRISAGHGRLPVLREVDLEMRPGELVGLMGRNGCGKTTLLRTAMGLHRPTSGRVVAFGRDVAGLHASELARAGAGYVPQNPGSLLFAERLRDELAFTRRHLGGRDGEADDILTRLGLAAAADRNPRDLSGGERERAALAAVLVGKPRLLLLDEPTRGMDYVRKRELGEILTDLCRDGVAVVVATHDVELVATIASRVVLLGDGGIVADGSPRTVLTGSLTYATQINKLYGDGFLTVADVIAGLDEEPGA
jgi:energy-coupling factor transport system ATP-binding protein